MIRTRLDILFKEKGADALISNAPQTRLWYAGVQTSDGYLIIEEKQAYLYVDGRYIEYCQNNAKNVEVRLLEKGSLQKFFDEKDYKHVVLEKDYLIYEEYDKLVKMIKPRIVGWIHGQELRIQKDEEEKQKLQKAVDISLEAYEELLQWIKPGMTEKEVAAKLNYLLKMKGADKESFDEIVAFGPNSAEPHHHPTNDKLEEGQLFKCDFGALYEGYHADITRTLIYGGAKMAKNPELAKILRIVNEAAAEGRKAVRPGILASEIDAVCREYISKEGYADYFIHSTGHGLGIDIHELPNVCKTGDFILEPGMVITVEPGIYIPGVGGARTEDDVIVTENGRHIFSRPEEN